MRPLSAERPAHRSSTYIFGAICPKEGKAVGLILPKCNTEAMQLHLDEIAKDVAPGRHAVLLLDQAGWHMSGKLDVPGNLTLVSLPAKCPELNPTENIWEFMRDNWLSTGSSSTLTICSITAAKAWNKLEADMAPHVHRNARLGPQVLINDTVLTISTYVRR